MQEQLLPNVTRRTFLVASWGFLLPRVGWSEAGPQPILHWPLDRKETASREVVTRSKGTLVDGTGRLSWVEEAKLSLPRLDGYSVWLEHRLPSPVALEREFGLSAWIALESFPVTTASIIEWGDEPTGVRLAVDRLGFALCSVRMQGKTAECRAEQPLQLRQWQHLAAAFSADGALLLFIDGREVARSTGSRDLSSIAEIEMVFLGRTAKEEMVAKVFPTNVLNGLVREVRVYKSHLTLDHVESLSREFQSKAPAPLATNPTLFADDPQRPMYHAMPPRAWTNEPHGLVRFRGQYHLFYQKNANGPYWGHIHWGHMTSPDLLHWTEQPMALVPSPGPDSEGCWSGSAIVTNDKIVLIYTGGDGKRASICMASSEDGLNFRKQPGNPIIEAPPTSIHVKEFRDPFIWEEGAEYRMIIGSGVTDVGGTALLYRSTNLTSWTYLKPLFAGDKTTSGVFWEMPVFIKIGRYHVLIVCEVPGRASYWVGTWENDEFQVLSTEPKRLDLLNHFLSPTPYLDGNGRAITIGIVPDTRDALAAWQAGWAHLYGLPRELSLDADGRLQQGPIAELAQRFTVLLDQQQTLAIRESWTAFHSTGTCVSIRARIEEGTSTAVVFALRRSPDRQEETLLRYDWNKSELSLDRTKASLNSHTHRDIQTSRYEPLVPGKLGLEIYLDNSVLEVFVDGRSCFASRIYPVLPESVGFAVSAEGGDADLAGLQISTLRNQEPTVTI